MARSNKNAPPSRIGSAQWEPETQEALIIKLVALPKKFGYSLPAKGEVELATVFNFYLLDKRERDAGNTEYTAANARKIIKKMIGTSDQLTYELGQISPQIKQYMFINDRSSFGIIEELEEKLQRFKLSLDSALVTFPKASVKAPGPPQELTNQIVRILTSAGIKPVFSSGDDNIPYGELLDMLREILVGLGEDYYKTATNKSIAKMIERARKVFPFPDLT